MIDFSVKSNTSGISNKVKQISTNKSLGSFLANIAAVGMDKYVPFHSGTLAGSVTTAPFKVSYNAPYAKYVYYGQGKNFSRAGHPNATAEWAKAYAIADGQKLGNAGTVFLKGM